MSGRGRVLITGGAGLIGSVLRERLADHYDVTATDRRRAPGVKRLDVRRVNATASAMAGQDVIVDLAASAALPPWEDVLANNIPASYNTLEAARRAGVRRVIVAGSNHVTGLYERDLPYSAIVAGHYEGLDPSSIPMITAAHPVRPDGPYGVGKVLTEAAARYYADEFGMSIICLRIGTCLDTDRPRRPRHFATLLSHADLVRLVRACIDASESVRFAVFYGVSANTWRFWDIADAERLVGYHPLDDAERWRATAGTGAATES